MPNINVSDELIETLREGLAKTNDAQGRLENRLSEVKTEASRLQAEIEALKESAEKTAEVIESLVNAS